MAVPRGEEGRAAFERRLCEGQGERRAKGEPATKSPELVRVGTAEKASRLEAKGAQRGVASMEGERGLCSTHWGREGEPQLSE